MFIIGILLGAAALMFILQNFMVISVNFLVWHFDGSLAFVILLSVVAGVLIGALLSLPELMRRGSHSSRLEKYNRQLATELDVHKEKLAATEAKLEVTETPIVIETTNPNL